MSTIATIADSGFVCACRESMRSACAGEPSYGEHQGKLYCVLHFPDKEKSGDFGIALQRKLDNKDFDFRGVWFPQKVSFERFNFSRDADFRAATFREQAYFHSATFSQHAYFHGATFAEQANFRSATFCKEADFRSATFCGAVYFSFAIFKEEAHFRSATFDGAAYFNNATFSATAHFNNATFHSTSGFNNATFGAAAYFREATFNAAAYFFSATFAASASFTYSTFNAELHFSYAFFANHVRFAGSEHRKVFNDTSSLDLQFARLERPDLVSFHTLRLRAQWFVNVEALEFHLTNITWDGRRTSDEIKSLTSEGVPSPHGLLADAYRQLAVNAENSHHYEDASQFRFKAMDARRLETGGGFTPWRMSWWYWLASGYGERVFQAFLVLLAIWFVAGLLYTRVGFARWEPRLLSEVDAAVNLADNVGTPLQFPRALTYSAGVMTLQRPEPHPTTTAAQTVVLLETILGPLQAALLALAIRRKFMR